MNFMPVVDGFFVPVKLFGRASLFVVCLLVVFPSAMTLHAAQPNILFILTEDLWQKTPRGNRTCGETIARIRRCCA